MDQRKKRNENAVIENEFIKTNSTEIHQGNLDEFDNSTLKELLSWEKIIHLIQQIYHFQIK